MRAHTYVDGQSFAISKQVHQFGQQVARWRVVGDRLTLELDGRDEPKVLTRGAVAPRGNDRAQR